MTLTHEWEQFLEKNHKIKREVWQKRGVSFDTDILSIPYFSPNGTLLYTKKRREPNYNGSNKYLYPSGSQITLYPSQDLSGHQEWILTEGELDTLTLESFDIPAVTAGGVTSFKSEFVNYFKDRKVYICFDNDKSGKQGAEKVALTLVAAGVETFIIDLPEMEKAKDIGDYFSLGHTKEEFIKLKSDARKIEQKITIETENPEAIAHQELLNTTLTYAEVENKVAQLLPNSQTGLKIVLAVAVSCKFNSRLMLWLLLVGVPSSGKTDLVRLVKDATDISFYLDNLTQNAFISGERATKSQKVYDLLPLINKKCLIIKDWTSIFSLDENMTKKLLGDLVGIYDREFTKFSSRRGNISYTSAFSQLGCITPATLNKHTNYMNMVGPRFLCYTMPPTNYDDGNISYDLIFSNSDRSLIEKEARLYVSSYLNQLAQQTPNIKPYSQNVKEYLRTAAELMSNCRGIAMLAASSFKNEDGEEVKYYEVADVQIEEPWRAVQQLIELAKYLVFVVGKDELGVEELAIIKEVVISSMPADRSQALRLIKDHEGEITAKELADLSDRSPKTSRRLLDELVALKALEKIKGSGTLATDYKINDQFKDFLLLDTSDFMSLKIFSGTETPHGIEETEQEALI
ncbi:hypothetical protein BH09PAT1_BH09PAT1_4010 [soil metagenome]